MVLAASPSWSEKVGIGYYECSYSVMHWCTGYEGCAIRTLVALFIVFEDYNTFVDRFCHLLVGIKHV